MNASSLLIAYSFSSEFLPHMNETNLLEIEKSSA